MTSPITTNEVGIYEPIYLKSQSLSHESLIAYPHDSNRHFSHWREFRIHVEMFRKRLFKAHTLTGLFSPKFQLKTKITSTQFITFCTANQDSDVVFINPFPHLAYLSFNIWMQAEANHPGIVEVASKLLLDAGIDLQINTTQRHDNTVLAYSSFWCGSSKFWHTYVGRVLHPLAVFIEENPDTPSVRTAMKETFHTDSSPYLPFITERLFTTFIGQQSDLKICHYPLDPIEYCFNQQEIDLLCSLQKQIDKADLLGNHPSTLKQEMQAICSHAANSAKEYFRIHKHPHTGRYID